MMRTTDRLMGPRRGTLRQALAYAARTRFPNGDQAIVEYLTEIYWLAPTLGLDPSIAVAQAVHETANFTSRWWVERLNPAGLGITGDPRDNEQSRDFGTGTNAARAHLAHLLVYALGPSDAGSLWHRTATGDDHPLSQVTPRYEAYLAAYGNTAQAETIAGLAGTWAVDPAYADKIAVRGNAIFPNLSDQTGDSMALDIDVSLAGRNLGKLTDPDAWVTLHNTGNNVNRTAERNFVASGGGDSGVAYHFAVDETGATQILPLDRQGVHAGNTTGNRTSIAIEMCELREPWDQIEANTATLLVAIVTGDARLDYGSFGKGNFSLSRVRGHRNWPGANPNCPRRLIQRYGANEVEAIVAKARALMADTPAYAAPHPPKLDKRGQPYPHKDEGDNIWLPLAKRRWKALRQTARREWADPNAKEVAAPVAKDATVTFLYSVANDAGETFFVSKNGSRCLANDFIPGAS